MGREMKVDPEPPRLICCSEGFPGTAWYANARSDSSEFVYESAADQPRVAANGKEMLAEERQTENKKQTKPFGEGTASTENKKDPDSRWESQTGNTSRVNRRNIT